MTALISLKCEEGLDLFQEYFHKELLQDCGKQKTMKSKNQDSIRNEVCTQGISAASAKNLNYLDNRSNYAIVTFTEFENGCRVSKTVTQLLLYHVSVS